MLLIKSLKVVPVITSMIFRSDVQGKGCSYPEVEVRPVEPGKGQQHVSVNQRREQAMNRYKSLKADDLTTSIPNLIHKWIETIQLAIAAGNTGLKEVDHEATLFAKQLKLNVDKAYVNVSSRRSKLISDGKKLTHKVKGSFGVEQPYPTQAEYLMLREYKEILEGYLDTVGTGALKVLLYDQRSDIVCPTATHPWTYLFIKFSEFEKNANIRATGVLSTVKTSSSRLFSMQRN